MIASSRRAVLLLPALLAGCQWIPRGQYDTLKTQNTTLLQQVRAQQAELDNLKIHSRNIGDQLARAEEDLARLDARTGGPAGRSGRLPERRGGLSTYGATGAPAAINDRLLELARQYPRLKYDAQSGVCKLEADVQFESGNAVLGAESEQIVGEVARVLNSPPARDLKVMVVGHTDRRGIKGRDLRQRYPTNWHLSAARAVAVAERLRAAGIPEDRMGVAGFAQHQPLESDNSSQAQQRNRRVEIFLVGADTPVVGWHESRDKLVR